MGYLLALISCHVEDPATPGLLVPQTVAEAPSLPSILLNGTQLHVETFGQPSDPLLVLIHGGPGGDYRSLLNARAFASDGFFVIFYDQRGTGLSKREDKSQFEEGGIGLMIEDLNALIGHFQLVDTQKVFLLGHSWGAMLATAFVNQYPEKIDGVVLAEPGGFTWAQTSDYLSRSNKINLFSEALNDAIFPEQLFIGSSEQEVLDYKASYFATFENAPGNTIGNPGPYPFWRNGAVSFEAMIDYAEREGFDFTDKLKHFKTPILFLYSEWNRAYGLDWARQVSAAYPNTDLKMVKGCGHEMLHFGWTDLYPKALTYLNELK